MAFYVGQRVECIDDSPGPLGRPAVRKGRIYTIVSTHNGGVCLAEVRPRIALRGFLEWRFRPITERKTDISLFKAMLNPSKQEVSA